MCRHLGYIGSPITLASLVLEAPHSLLRQSYQPREQTRGVVNADGFGVGWYEPAIRPEPARYRNTAPIWADASFASFAPVIRSTALVGSVRSATPPNPIEASGVAPFTSGRWLFAHNGAVEGYRSGGDGQGDIRTALASLVTPGRLAGLDGSSDSELLFALTLDRLDGGDGLGSALAQTVSAVQQLTSARLNLLASDGEMMAATACGDSLYVSEADDGVTIASEPLHEGRWRAVPDHSLVVASSTGVEVSKL